MCKINYINKDRIQTETTSSNLIGSALHEGFEVYCGGGDEDGKIDVQNESDGIVKGLQIALSYIEGFNEGWIKWQTTCPDRATAFLLVTNAFNEYVKHNKYDTDKIIGLEEEIEEYVDVDYNGNRLCLPIKLKGKLDRIERDELGRIIIKDYKHTFKFSDPEKLSGRKIIQAITYYFLVYAKYGEAPYAMIFEEVMGQKTQGKYQPLPIIYEEEGIMFDFFLRYYDDATKYLMGEAVYLPNVDAMFDNDIALVAYAYRLDEPEEMARQMKELKVKNITDLLRKKVTLKKNSSRLLKTLEKSIAEYKEINYSQMKTEERLAHKMAESGMLMQFVEKIEGPSVNLYRFNPGIGIKMSKVRSYIDDIEQITERNGCRILAPEPNTSYVSFEVPREERTFRSLPAGKASIDSIAMGVSVNGETKTYDIRDAPHMLVAGSTGSGKSVFLTATLNQLLRCGAEVIICDPKGVDFNGYQGRVKEYADNQESIAAILIEQVKEMDARYELLKEKGLKNNRNGEVAPVRFIIIDEYADIASVSVTLAIKKLAQKSRAAGIHLILATQRASSKIIDGDIKINFPVKVVLRMSKVVDSMVMIDEPGAERLLGKGDLLFCSPSGVERLQGFSS